MRKYGPFLVLAAAVAVAFVAFNGPFTYDDKIEVIGNPAVRAERWYLAIPAYNPSRIVVLYSYALNWMLGGFDSRGYHAVSIAIHALNGWLVYRLFSRLMAWNRALFGMAVWALHPLTTEGVSYISGRSDALVATTMLFAAERWLVDSQTPNPRARMSAYIALFLALFTKETAAILPFLLLLADWACVAGGRWRLVNIRRYWPMILLLAAGVAGRLWSGGWPVPEVPRTLAQHVVTQAEVWTRYLQLWILPWGQSIVQPVEARVSAVGVVSAVAWVVALGWAFRKGGITALAACVWGFPLAISSAFVLKETMAEHRSYVAGVGVALFAASRLSEWRYRWCLPVVLGVLTVHRNLQWTDEPTLWRAAADRWPGRAEPWFGYGDALRFAQRFAEAETAYAQSLAMHPEQPDAWVNIGIARAERGDDGGARTAWESALALRPGHCAALNNLAALLVKQGKSAEAASGYAATLRSCPDDPMANFNLGVLLSQTGDQTRAIFHLRRYLDAQPTEGSADVARAELRRLGAAP